jgi:hypothetical protein
MYRSMRRKFLLAAVVAAITVAPAPAPAQCVANALDGCGLAFPGYSGSLDAVLRALCAQLRFALCALSV